MKAPEEPLELHGVRHLAVIMDGNGRWAGQKGLRRTRGHRVGADSVRRVVTECAAAGLGWLSLYALSTENYRARPPREVQALMGLLKRFVVGERDLLMEKGIRFRTAGRVDELPQAVVREVRRTERLTAENAGMQLVLCLNYGGRAELVDAARGLCREVASGRLTPDEVDEVALAGALYVPEMPDVDLLVRTAGELRVSNYLLWQISYAEITSTRVLWPDFGRVELAEALADYSRRRRRFGGLEAKEESS